MTGIDASLPETNRFPQVDVLLAGKKWGDWLLGRQQIVCNKQAMIWLKGGRRELGLRKPHSSLFCKTGDQAMPVTAALTEADGTSSEMYFSCILKESSRFWVGGLTWDSLSALYLQMSLEKFLSRVNGS